MPNTHRRGRPSLGNLARIFAALRDAGESGVTLATLMAMVACTEASVRVYISQIRAAYGAEIAYARTTGVFTMTRYATASATVPTRETRRSSLTMADVDAAFAALCGGATMPLPVSHPTMVPVPTVALRPAPIAARSAGNDTIWAGMPEGLREFYAERAMELGRH